MFDSIHLESMLSGTSLGTTREWLLLVITLLHLLAGSFIIIGLFTRMSTLLLIPVCWLQCLLLICQEEYSHPDLNLVFRWPYSYY
ncbi:MAG: hypothetical protein ACXWWD_01850 [Chitinophagaceae bacterium]